MAAASQPKDRGIHQEHDQVPLLARTHSSSVSSSPSPYLSSSLHGPFNGRCSLLFNEYEVDPAAGLSGHEIHSRTIKYGVNELSKDPPKSPWKMLYEQLTDYLVLMLIAACVISMVTGQFAAAVTIIIIIVANATLGVLQESKAGAALEALSQLAAHSAHAIRDGQLVSVASSSLVPGDIVILDTGNKVPADGVILKCEELRVNESCLTGESAAVKKRPVSEELDEGQEAAGLTDQSMVYMGSTVSEGKALVLITKTGMKTRMGEVADLLEKAEEGDSPLQIKLEDLGQKLGLASLGVSILVFVIGVTTGRGADPTSDQPLWLQMLLVAVSLTVAAVPEGLPTCVTITLAIGMQNMVAKHALIRNLHSVETLGSCSVICTDKTGTLTAGVMTTVKMAFAGGIWRFTGVGWDLSGRLLPVSDFPHDVDSSHAPHRLPVLSGLICSNAWIQTNERTGEIEVMGNASDRPLVVAAAKIGLTRQFAQLAYPRIKEIPFNSTKKLMTVIVKPASEAEAAPFLMNGQDANGLLMICKGAPDVLLARCSFIVDYVAGSNRSQVAVRRLTDEDRVAINRNIDKFSTEALRVLATAFRVIPTSAVAGDGASADWPAFEHDLTYCGALASIDPERPQVREAIARAAHAGIRTLMITGDYKHTAAAIAHRIGLIQDDQPGKAIDCEALRGPAAEIDRIESILADGKARPHDERASLRHSLAQHQQRLDALIEHADVYARAQPSDKLIIVRALQRRGEICCMTGDGINDAPAIKQANIGVAMGLTGTDVAKAAADMVLTDDNFVSIVMAVEEGRTIYNNISKFCFYLLSTNVAEVFLILLCVLAGMQSPLLPIQLLWLNLTTDGAPAIALALEMQEPGLMDMGPRRMSEPLMDRLMITGIVIQSIVLSAVCIFTYSLGLYWHLGSWLGRPVYGQTAAEIDIGVEHARTMVMILIVFAELARAYTCRTLRASLFEVGVASNRWMHYSVGVSLVATLIICHVPFLMTIFSLTDLNQTEWTLVLNMALIPVCVDELTKAVYRMTGFGLRPKNRITTQQTSDKPVASIEADNDTATAMAGVAVDSVGGNRKED